jgi:hypothetical protein
LGKGLYSREENKLRVRNRSLLIADSYIGGERDSLDVANVAKKKQTNQTENPKR